MKVDVVKALPGGEVSRVSFSMEHIPRQGDWIEIRNGFMGVVRMVSWVLGPAGEHRVEVRLE